MSCEKKVKDSVKLLIIFTRHLLIIEGDGHPVPLRAPGHEAHPEHGAPRRLHPCRDVVPGLGAHQDLQTTPSSPHHTQSTTPFLSHICDPNMGGQHCKCQSLYYIVSMHAMPTVTNANDLHT